MLPNFNKYAISVGHDFANKQTNTSYLAAYKKLWKWKNGTAKTEQSSYVKGIKNYVHYRPSHLIPFLSRDIHNLASKAHINSIVTI